MMPSEIIAWECGSCTFNNEGSEPRANAGDGIGNCAGPPVAQAPVLSAAVAGVAVAGVAGATARDGAGSRRGLLSRGLL